MTMTIKNVYLALCLLLLVGCEITPFYDDLPATPQPLAPSDGITILNNATVTFQWQSVPRATSYEFHVYDFTHQKDMKYLTVDLHPSDICVADVCSLEKTIAMEPSLHHAWRVRAVNNVGGSIWSRSGFVVNP
ncbi:MAG: hypothetical protein KTR35_14750 [Gammaproteobacteria bacterium]|nr:hypothetical protein [Gammaproteobacteria bacterium]